MSCSFMPGKLLICIVGRHRGERLVAISKEAGARGGTIALGRTLVDNRLLQAFSFADVHQDVVFTLMGTETPNVINAIKKATIEFPKKLAGTAIVLNVDGILSRMTQQQGSNMDQESMENQKMESGHKLITVIVNHGYADDVMAAARHAGAQGGTILTARGTGTEADVKFFGISIVPEKDMLIIVASREKVPTILTAISNISHLCEPGGGIVFNMNVEEFIVLGK